MVRVLTIAGSDSGGGAGVQADLKTIFALKAHPLTAITSLTAQNSLEISAIHDVPPGFVKAQILTVAGDMFPQAAKTGMLYNTEILSAVADAVEKCEIPFLVVDPVFFSSTGRPLLEQDALGTMKERLLPLATVVTPNLEEAGTLSGQSIKNLDDMEEAAKAIKDLGPENVVITGGHLERECTDILLHKGRIYSFKGLKIDTEHTHGSGCVFSAALAVFLAMGYDIVKGVDMARQYTRKAISKGLGLGKGPGCVQPPQGGVKGENI